MLSTYAKRTLSINLLSSLYANDAFVTRKAAEFARTGYALLPQLLSPECLGILGAEAQDILPQLRSRDFIMPGCETPRVLSTLGGEKLRQASESIWTVYANCDLRDALQRIAGARLFHCQHSHEYLALNVLDRVGGTHGWHLDDPTYGLVICLEAPVPGAGGVFEFIPGWGELAAANGGAGGKIVPALIEALRQQGKVHHCPFAPGDAHFVRTDTSLHHVSPLTQPGTRRVILNMAFEADTHPRYGESGDLFYGEES